jgi:hypothetical protein
VTRVLLVLLCLTACASEAEPQPRTESPPATTERSSSGSPTDAGEPPEAAPVPLPLEHVDDTQGAIATLVYVTEQRVRGAVQPGAIILSSDESNPHFARQNTARVTVHKLTRADMAALLSELGSQGFDRLPWQDQAYDAEIGPQRAFYLYRDGARRCVEKEPLQELDRHVFTDLERRIIERTTRAQ